MMLPLTKDASLINIKVFDLTEEMSLDEDY